MRELPFSAGHCRYSHSVIRIPSNPTVRPPGRRPRTAANEPEANGGNNGLSDDRGEKADALSAPRSRRRLSKPLGNQQFQEVHDALMENLVVFFRDQKLSSSSTRSSAAGSASCTSTERAERPEDHPEILPIQADENSKRVAGEGWHSDVSCDAEPPMGSILYLTEVPPDGGGDTMFASMYAAYETLSAPIKQISRA